MVDTLIARIEELSQTQGDKEAVIFKKEALTYGQLSRAIKRAGAILSSFGVKRGDRVLFTALSKPEMFVTYLGIQYAGGVVVFLDKNATPENMAMVYEDTQAALILTDKPLKEYEEKCRKESLKAFYARVMDPEENVEDMPYVRPDDEDMAEMIFTTGTTGRPKGVVLSYRAVYHILTNTKEGTRVREDERMLMPLPLNHSLALRVSRAILYSGATIVLQNGFAFARELESNIIEKQCSAMTTVPASLELVRMQMQDKFPEILGKLRYIEVGAGSLTIRQRREVTSLLPNTQFFNTWGSSETGGVLFTDVNAVVGDDEKVACIGKVLPGRPANTVQVLDMEDKPIARSDREHPGRLVITGDMVMSGYYGREEQTREALHGNSLYTNDLVYTDEEGYVYMLGRIDDIINVGGEKVSPIEVENIACQYEGIRECACIGVPDPDEVLGQIPVLYVAPNSAYNEDELKVYLSKRMERYKLPLAYEKVSELPRNRMKKIDRKAMRSLWEKRGEAKDLNNPVIENILNRHSVRKFTDQDIPGDMLEMILKAGYYAPTGKNLQTWRFTVVKNADQIYRLREAAMEAAAANKVNCYGFNNPKVLVLVSNDVRNHDGGQDASCAAENMMLAANSYGLGAAWLNVLMTLRDASPVKEMLDEWGIPANHTVWSMVALGYPAEKPKSPARKTNVVHYV